MKDAAARPSYAGYRFPPAIIAPAVWRYFRFALSYRDVAELLAERGIVLSDETVRQWCQKFGQQYASALRRRRPKPGDKWLCWPFAPSAVIFWQSGRKSAGIRPRME